MLIENNQHYTTQEIALILKISKSIKLLVKMKNISFILQKKTQWTFWQTQHIKRKNNRIDSNTQLKLWNSEVIVTI